MSNTQFIVMEGLAVLDALAMVYAKWIHPIIEDRKREKTMKKLRDEGKIKW